jgi:hypothetical protein
MNYKTSFNSIEQLQNLNAWQQSGFWVEQNNIGKE